MPAAPRNCRRSLLALLLALAALLACAGPGRAARFAPVIGRRVPGVPAGARNLGRLAAGTELRLTVALRPRDPQGLAAYAAAVSRPGSPDYHRYLTVAQFAERFGPTAAELRAAREGLAARGLRVGATSANRLAITVRASAAVTADAFGISIDRYAVQGGGRQIAAVGRPRVAGIGSGVVQGVVGLDSVAPRASIEIRVPHRARAHGRPRVTARARTHASGHAAASGPQACAAASAEASAAWGFTPAQIAAHYGLSGFYAAGDEGSGVTVALYELEPFNSADVAAYQACMGTSSTIDVTTVDGGPGTGSGSGEAAADVEDVIGLAPKAQIQVYEGPPTAQGAYDTYSAIISQDSAQIVSTSWGLCEAEVGRAELLAESTLFQEAAAQGQTVVAASGDSGSNDCGNGQLSVDDPGSQPWVTSVGGTHLLTAGDSVWNDGAGASGGGVSQVWGRPAWQSGAPAQSAVTCGAAGTLCREVPDISANADPDSGYTAYFRGAWRTVGGTSVAAPTIASLAALAEAAPACAGRRLGFLDPALYADAADIQDVTSGTNAFGGVAGYAAGAGYDLASGLGAPTAALGPALCGDALSLQAPAAQGWTAGRHVSLALSAHSSLGGAVSWSATGLPAGITLGGRTGRIAGAPAVSGSFTVSVTAVDADGATRTISFPVTVAPRPVRSARGARSRATPARRRHRPAGSRRGSRIHRSSSGRRRR